MAFHTSARLMAAALVAFGASSTLLAQDSPPPLPDQAETKSTASGLKYTVIEPGEGRPLASPGDTVTAHYTGWLKDGGTKFDSSRDRGQPFQFVVGQGVIPGWSEGIQLMPKGAVYRFEVPPDLGYGSRGAGGVIPPDATLLFDIELLDVATPPKMPAANPDAQKTLEEGIVYEVLSEGEGETYDGKETFVMHFSLFKPDGELLESSKTANRPLKANVENMRFPVLQKVPLVMKKGTVLRVEASRDKGLGDRSPPEMDKSIWVLEMVDILEPMEVPEFGMPAEEELQSSDSGLKWKVLKEGEGDSPDPSDTVTVHYAGRLTDGTLFDSSFGRGEPATFPLRGVIPGWTEGVSMMKPGEIRLFVIPPDLAYGERGAQPKIGPNETLVFWIELVKVGS